MPLTTKHKFLPQSQGQSQGQGQAPNPNQNQDQNQDKLLSGTDEPDFLENLTDDPLEWDNTTVRLK